MKLLGEPVKVSNTETVMPEDGVNVFFYLNQELKTAKQVQSEIQ